MLWLKDGDSNTKFFCASASTRKKRNYIKNLTNVAGDLVFNKQGLCDLAQEYFDELFCEQGVEFAKVVDAAPSSILGEDNKTLLLPFLDEVFRAVTFQKHPDKAPGPDGLNSGFYRHFWHVCGGDVIAACHAWLESGSIPGELNVTRIVLIPKCDNPRSIRDLRPISLCNVAYKNFVKTLANMLAKVIPKFIYEEQSTFIVGRYIIEMP